MFNTKTVTLIQLLGVALQLAAPQIVDDSTSRLIYHGAISVGQMAAGIAALFKNPNGSSAKEPYVKYRRKIQREDRPL